MKHAFISKLRYMAMMLSCVAVAMTTGCDNNDEPDAPAPPPTPPVERPTSRTVLVYMVANNNLGGYFDNSDLKEMTEGAAAGMLGDGRLVVYHSASSGIVLKEVTKDGIDTLKVYDNKQLSVSVDRMRNVITDVKTLAPAEDYGLVLWSHASGWIQDGIEDTRARSFGVDGPEKAKMNVTSLAEAIEDADFKFIYFDCCYMGTVEVAYELRNCTPYIVASPAEDPADGMPYNQNLKFLMDTKSDVKDAMISAAKTTFDYYNDVFEVGDCPCTMTVVKTDGLDALASATAKLYESATRTYNIDYSYQKFTDKASCSYFDLDQYVESLCDDEAMLIEWRDALSKAVIYAEATPYLWSSFPIEHCCGLSTNIITSKTAAANKNYNTLSWYNDVVYKLFK